jgi:hypothetical protein
VKTRVKQLLWVSLILGSGCGALLVVLSLRSTPTGRYASYSILPHDSCDVFAFSGGNVTWQTCCGDDAYGTYRQMPGGAWVWSAVHGTKKRSTNTFALRPGVFYMSFTDLQNPTNKFSLRRRLSAKWPF